MAKAAIKSMNLEQAQAYKQELESQGKTESTSKEYGKLSDYIKTLQPEKYSAEELGNAYSKLSRGVTTTGGFTEKNLDNIEKYTGVRPQLSAPSAAGGEMGTAGDLTNYLNNFQDSVFQSAGSVELRDSIVQNIEPDIAKPEPLKRADEYEKLRTEMGVADLETSLNDLKAQLEEQYAIRRQRTQSAEGKPVAMGVIAGRVGEIERQENERIDAIGRQINVIGDQLNTKYNVISTYMNFMGLDYQDAVTAYNTEYNRNLDIYKLVDSELDEQKASAKANLQIFQNAILSGNVSFNSLSGDQKSFISKLEAQSGLPIGFTASLKPDEKVLYSGTREVGNTKYLDVITQGANGQPISKTITLGASGGGTGGSGGKVNVADLSKQMTAMLSGKVGGDGKVSPNTWNTAMRAWVSETGQSEDEFAKKFGSYVNKSYAGWENDYSGF